MYSRTTSPDFRIMDNNLLNDNIEKPDLMNTSRRFDKNY